MSLRDNVFQLCSPHLKTGPDNKPHKVPALLDELRAAVTPGHAGSAGGSVGGPPIPINPNALDLLSEIETDARTDYAEMTGERWPGDLIGLLRAVAILDLTPEWSGYLEHVSQDWIDKINAMLWLLIDDSREFVIGPDHRHGGKGNAEIVLEIIELGGANVAQG